MEAVDTVRNGIDVGQLVETIGAVKTDESLGRSTFKASSIWREGTRNSGQIIGFVHAGAPDTTRSVPFTLEGDEPPVLLGNNAGPNAVELLLQALGFCYGVGYVANAAAQGIDITSLEIDVEGDLDVRSFLGLQGPRAGFTGIRAKAKVSSPNASEAQLQDLCRYVLDTSPVRDCLANPVAVKTVLEIV
jgi:uncharacterized OsmC-like protein